MPVAFLSALGQAAAAGHNLLGAAFAAQAGGGAAQLQIYDIMFDDAGNLTGLKPLMPSRPGEFHPEPLTDPDLTLSRHPARATARRLPPSIEYRVPPVAG